MPIDPITASVLTAVALGITKDQLIDQPAAKRKRKLNSEIAKYSPWTNMTPQIGDEPNGFATALQGGMAGLQFGQALEGRAHDKELLNLAKADSDNLGKYFAARSQMEGANTSPLPGGGNFVPTTAGAVPLARDVAPKIQGDYAVGEKPVVPTFVPQPRGPVIPMRPGPMSLPPMPPRPGSYGHGEEIFGGGVIDQRPFTPMGQPQRKPAWYQLLERGY